MNPIWTDHLKVITYPGGKAAAPGDRTALVIEVQPAAGMHIYASGAEGYKPLALTLAPQLFVRVVPLQFPPSEIYVFAPLNERVPVYQKPFTPRQELVLENRPEARAAFRGKSSLTVTGTLSYQACDDRMCFNPVTVPLTWSVPLESAGGRQLAGGCIVAGCKAHARRQSQCNIDRGDAAGRSCRLRAEPWRDCQRGTHGNRVHDVAMPAEAGPGGKARPCSMSTAERGQRSDAVV